MIDQSREVSKLNSSAKQSHLPLTVIWTMAAMSLNSCFHASHPYHETGTDCDRPSDAVKSLNSEAAKTEEDKPGGLGPAKWIVFNRRQRDRKVPQGMVCRRTLDHPPRLHHLPIAIRE